MRKFKEYEVIFQIWKVKSVTVIAGDADEAIDLAVDDTYFEDGEDYDVVEVIEREMEKHDV